ncbi:Uncharacterised protein [Pragia fontium]|nr:Uncharacterised protein [Pragia fontium]VEJ55154.1 Uncharacterised protein [Pragia fontium]
MTEDKLNYVVVLLTYISNKHNDIEKDRFSICEDKC